MNPGSGFWWTGAAARSCFVRRRYLGTAAVPECSSRCGCSFLIEKESSGTTCPLRRWIRVSADSALGIKVDRLDDMILHASIGA